MRVLHVGVHGNHDNADEDSISAALESLGHEVVKVHEYRRHRRRGVDPTRVGADACLFHKWSVISEIAELRCPAFFWFFDMLSGPADDPTLFSRSATRERWLADVLALPNVILGALTDGDAVARDTSGKLVHLLQGADERVAGFGVPNSVPGVPEILFAGMVHHGRRRAEHVAHLRRRWGSRFGVMGDDGPASRKHGRELADVFASTKVVVAPDGPCTQRYHSNRLYLVTSLGGFLVHPHSELVASQYPPCTLATYRDRDECDAIIERALEDEGWRNAVRIAGHQHTLRYHCYRHRCAELMRVVEERMDG